MVDKLESLGYYIRVVKERTKFMLSTTGFSNPLGQFAVVRLSMSGADAIPCLTWIDHDVAIAWSRDLNRSIQGTRASFWVVPAEIQLDVDLIMNVGLAIKF